METKLNFKKLTKSEMKKITGGTSYSCVCSNGKTFTTSGDPIEFGNSFCSGANVHCIAVQQ